MILPDLGEEVDDDVADQPHEGEEAQDEDEFKQGEGLAEFLDGVLHGKFLCVGNIALSFKVTYLVDHVKV